jgi:uncharacterized Ntn-hydrolase superfamily protein
VTFSIVAHDPATGDWGVAVASKFPAVGAVVPHARAGVGALATQAWANVAYGPDGLDLLAEGRTAGEVVDALSARFGERFAQIAGVGSLVVNGDRATRSTVLADGDELAVLPPVSGG